MFSLFNKKGEMFKVILFCQVKYGKTCLIRAFNPADQTTSRVKLINSKELSGRRNMALLQVEEIPLLSDFYSKGYDDVKITDSLW